MTIDFFFTPAVGRSLKYSSIKFVEGLGSKRRYFIHFFFMLFINNRKYITSNREIDTL